MTVEFLTTLIISRHPAPEWSTPRRRASRAGRASLYMACATVQEKGALAVEEDTVSRSASKIFWSGILNPKLTIFFLAVLP